MSSGATPRATLTPGSPAYRERDTGTIRVPITVLGTGPADLVLSEVDAEILHAYLTRVLAPAVVAAEAQDW